MTARPAFVDDYLPALLARAHLLISSEFHRVVKAWGLNVSEWRVLSTLADRDDPISVGQLMQVTVTKQSTLTVVVDRLVQRGSVLRVSHGSDGRVTLVEITPAGRKLVTKLIDLAREHERRVLEPFGLRRGAELKSTLRRLIHLHAAETEPAESGSKAKRSAGSDPAAEERRPGPTRRRRART